MTPASKEIEARRAARTSFMGFVRYMAPWYRFNWHHRLMCEALERWAFGDIQRLMIFAPPRHGKSETVVKLLPSYVFGRVPDAHQMVCCYSNALATDSNAGVQQYIDSERYRAVFPETTLAGVHNRTMSGRWIRNSDEFDIVDRRGKFRSAGIGGSITGKGFTHGYIDDPFRNRADADSFAKRQSTDSWYQSTFRTRRANDRAREMMILTRWHSDDLAGRCLKRMEESPLADQWSVLTLPAVREPDDCLYDPRRPGTALWPALQSTKYLMGTKATVDPYEWASVYQQRPTPRGGAMFEEHWLRPAEVVERRGRKFFRVGDGAGGHKLFMFERCAWFQTIDTAQSLSRTADYTVIMTMALLPNGHLVVWHVLRARLTVPQQFPAIHKMYRGCPPVPYARLRGEFDTWEGMRAEPWPVKLTAQIVETATSGRGLIQQAAAKGLPLRGIDADGNKVRRAGPAAGMFRNGSVWYNPAAKGDWLEEWAHEVVSFPGGEHDDQVDCLSYGCQIALYDDVMRAGLAGLDDYSDDDPAPKDRYTIDPEASIPRVGRR